MADWSTIEALPQERLEALFANDPDRLKRLSLDVAGIHFDWSKTHLTAEALTAFEALAKSVDLAGKREAMFAGANVNVTVAEASHSVLSHHPSRPLAQIYPLPLRGFWAPLRAMPSSWAGD